MSNSRQVHGGPDPTELTALGLSREDVLDASVNINPYGPCPAVVAGLSAMQLSDYPHDGAARRSLAADHRTVAIGAGAAELLWTLARALVGAGSTVVTAPTFSEWGAAVRAGGGQVVETAYDAAAIAAAARDASAVYLCNPNNPTGAYLAVDVVAELAVAVPCPLVLDESFLSLSDRWRDATATLPANVVRVRSLTKDLGIPGVRVGYALAAPAIIAAIDAARPPWTASVAACTAVLARDDAWVARSRDALIRDRDATLADLRALGLDAPCSAAPFCVVPVGDGARVRRACLERHRVLVRDCASFGMPAWIRIAARPPAQRARILAALADSN